MHYTMRFYSRYQHRILRLYLMLARLTRLPLVGGLICWLANVYGKSEHQGYFVTLKEAEQIIDESKNVALGPCTCRQISHNCDAPVMAEIVVGYGVKVFSEIRPDEFYNISKEKAKEVMRQCHQMRLTPTFQKCRGDFYAICNCCTCCCVPLRLSQSYKIGSALVRDERILEKFGEQKL